MYFSKFILALSTYLMKSMQIKTLKSNMFSIERSFFFGAFAGLICKS